MKRSYGFLSFTGFNWTRIVSSPDVFDRSTRYEAPATSYKLHYSELLSMFHPSSTLSTYPYNTDGKMRSDRHVISPWRPLSTTSWRWQLSDNARQRVRLLNLENFWAQKGSGHQSSRRFPNSRHSTPSCETCPRLEARWSAFEFLSNASPIIVPLIIKLQLN